MISNVPSRVERDPVFAMALLDAADVLSLAGELDATCLILCDQVNAPVGFSAPTVSQITDSDFLPASVRAAPQ